MLSLARECVGLWNSAAGPSHPLTEALWSEITTIDPSFLAGDRIVHRDGGDLAGFALAKLFRRAAALDPQVAGVGYVSLLAVRPGSQNRGVGRGLLANAERYLREQGATRCILGGSYFHAVPGVPTTLPGAIEFFRRSGYQPGKTVWDLARDVRDFSLPLTIERAVEGAGIDVRLLGPSLRDPVAIAALFEFLTAEFPGRWPNDVAFGLGRPDAQTAIVTLFEGTKAVGFTQVHPPGSPGTLRWQGFAPEVAAIGPVGVAKAHQGRGLGLAVVALAADVLRSWGASMVVIDWTDLGEFYGKLGFAPWLSYLRMGKALQDL